MATTGVDEVRREETEEPREGGRPTSPPGAVEMATERWRRATREAEPAGQLKTRVWPVRDQGLGQ